MPRFVIDEDIPRSTAIFLRKSGYEAIDIRDRGLRGSDDQVIYQFAQENHSVLITGDMHFSNILRFPIGSHFGIVIVHYPNEVSNDEINYQLIERFTHIRDDDFSGNLIIIEPGKTRIRRKPKDYDR